MATRTEQSRAREHVCRMISALSRADLSELETSIGSLISDGGDDRDLFYPVLAEMAEAIAQMARGRAGPSGPDTAFIVEIVDDEDRAVGIDELSPALRAVVRAVLALLEDHPLDARYQLEMAATDPDTGGRLDALLRALLFVRSLLDHDAGDVPSWLAVSGQV